MNELLHWLVDRVEARVEDREAAHQLVDQLAVPAETAAPGAQDAPERAREPGEGESQP